MELFPDVKSDVAAGKVCSSWRVCCGINIGLPPAAVAAGKSLGRVFA